MPVQAKLKVGRSDDALEREADLFGGRVAFGQSVAHLSHGATNKRLQSSPLQQDEEEESRLKSSSFRPEYEEEEEETVQRKANGIQASSQQPAINSRTDTHSSGGQALSESSRSFYEARFGRDFSQVRIHSGAKSDRAAKSINAQAFTKGQDIHFAKGKYSPGSLSGRRLIAHELTHVVQQEDLGASRRVQRKPDEKKDPEILLGEKLWRVFPDGVAVALYDVKEPVAKKAAVAWTKKFNAIAPGRGKISAKNIQFGKPIPDSRNVANTLVAIGKVIKSAVTKTAPSTIEMLGGEHGSVQRRANLSPAKISTLAIFAHGSEVTCGIGKGINRKNVEAKVKQLAPYLASNVKILMFACSTASGPEEYETVRDEWVKGSMEKGGKGSLSDKMRDALVKHGKKSAQVWGHTAAGHVSGNASLRIFYGKHGAGSLGESYVTNYIFTPTIVKQITQALKSEITAKGYSIADERKYKTRAEVLVNLQLYKCWISASEKRKFNGRPLAEMAPNFPHGVAYIVLKYWKSTWWPGRKDRMVKRLIRRLRLRKNH
jgi:hypothetical protein